MATTTHVTKTPGVLGGKAHLEAHRISVAVIAERLDAGESVEAVAEAFQISPEEVVAARDYWHDHREEIDQQREAASDLYDELMASSRAPSS